MKIKRLFLARRSRKDKRGKELIDRLKPGRVIEVEDVREADRILARFPDPVSEGKQSIFLDRFAGRFFEPCPCTKEYFRCGYWNLHPVAGCPIDCSYCVLQGYLNSYPVQVYLNLDDLFAEVLRFESAHPKQRLRVGTGELADSLALEPELGYAQKLVEFFRGRPNFIFELKTKSDRTEIFDGLKPSENIVVAWSVNPEAAALEEKFSAGIAGRVAAAQKVAGLGWPVGFHFDPVLDIVPLDQYLVLIDRIFAAVPAQSIAWISLGSLRFPARLKPLLKDRHPESMLLCGELFPGRDMKLRYLRPVREKIYRALIERIREHDRGVLVYLCMESPRMWEDLLGAVPDLIRRELAVPLSGRKRFKPGRIPWA